MKKIVKDAQPSMAMTYDIMAKQMIANGEKVYNLSAGDPNLPLSQNLIDAWKTIDLNKTHNYGSSQGLLELRQRIYPGNADKVVIANGCKQLITMALMATCRPEDEVVIIGPCWSSYMAICDMLQLKYKLIVGKEENLYKITTHQLSQAVTDDTCCILFNNPVNPTGAVYDEAFCKYLLGVSQVHNCWIISDEIYSDFVYDDNFYSLKGQHGVIYLNGFSKAYNLTGWRLGYATCEDLHLIQQMSIIQSQMSGPPVTPIQWIVARCYDDLIPTDKEIYKERIDYLCGKDEKFSKHKPQGGFYFYIPVTNSKAYCEDMLRNKHIVVTPGDDYGVPNTIRVSIASINLEELKLII